MTNSTRTLSAALLVAMVVSAPNAGAQTPTLTTLLNFTTTNGAYPFGGLVYASNGALYGATFGGGKYGLGNVFALTPSQGPTGWTASIVFNFRNPDTDGSNPYGSLLATKSGVLYGTTTRGGANDMGAVIRLTPPAEPGGNWTENVIYSFGSSPEDGAFPYGGLVVDAHGALYGTTVSGGTAGVGTVFVLTPSGGTWAETVLHNFGSGTDAANPYAGLAMDSAGTLYGSSPYGGTSGSGAVFSLTPETGGDWTEAVLCSFPGGNGGANPYGGVLIGSSGGLYGSTTNGGANGGGTVYRCAQSKTGTWLSSVLFSPLASAASYGTLVSDSTGAVYGTTSGAHGNASNNGTIYKVAPPQKEGGPWTASTLYSFPGSQGGGPRAGVIWGPNGSLFGTSVGLGTVRQGTVFQLSF